MDQFGLQLLQPPLGLLTLAEVADKAGEEALLARDHLADGQFHRKGRAVLPLADHHPADADNAPLSGGQIAIEVAVVVIAIGCGHEPADVLADHLLRRPAEQALGRMAEGPHDAVLGDHHHGVGHGGQNGLQMGLARAQVLVHGHGVGSHGLERFASCRDRRTDHQEDQPADKVPGCERRELRRHVQPAHKAQHRRQRSRNGAAEDRSADDGRNEEQERQPVSQQRLHGQLQGNAGSRADQGRHQTEACVPVGE